MFYPGAHTNNTTIIGCGYVDNWVKRAVKIV
jgi:hypothetical protein